MKISGKKIVSLTDEERAVLQLAIDLLVGLADEIGNESGFDFADLADSLYYVRTTDKFEIDFEQ